MIEEVINEAAHPSRQSRARRAPAGRWGRAVHDLAVAAKEVSASRDLVWQLTLRDIRIRYKQAAMGFAWAVLMPALTVIAGVIIRYLMARLGGGALTAQTIAGLAIKSLAWSFFVATLGFGTGSLSGNLSLVTKIYFPREVLPLSAVLGQLADFAVGSALLLLLLPFLGVHLSVALLWVPLLLVVLVAFSLAAVLFLSCANLFFRDVKYLVQVVLRFGIFFTPVFFEPQAFGALGSRLVMLNPVAPLLEGLRVAIVQGHSLGVTWIEPAKAGAAALVWSPWFLVYSAAWAVGGLLVSALLFHRSETLFAEYV